VPVRTPGLLVGQVGALVVAVLIAKIVLDCVAIAFAITYFVLKSANRWESNPATLRRFLGGKGGIAVALVFLLASFLLRR